MFKCSEQLLFSCVSSKVSICNYVTCRMSHVTCHMSYVKSLCWSLAHAEQFLFSCLCSNVAVYGWKCQWFFFDLRTLPCDNTSHRAGSQLKMSESQTKAGNQKKFENLKIWKFENLKIWKFENLKFKFKIQKLKWSSANAEQLLFSCLGSKVAL